MFPTQFSQADHATVGNDRQTGFTQYIIAFYQALGKSVVQVPRQTEASNFRVDQKASDSGPSHAVGVPVVQGDSPSVFSVSVTSSGDGQNNGQSVLDRAMRIRCPLGENLSHIIQLKTNLIGLARYQRFWKFVTISMGEVQYAVRHPS